MFRGFKKGIIFVLSFVLVLSFALFSVSAGNEITNEEEACSYGQHMGPMQTREEMRYPHSSTNHPCIVEIQIYT